MRWDLKDDKAAPVGYLLGQTVPVIQNSKEEGFQSYNIVKNRRTLDGKRRWWRRLKVTGRDMVGNGEREMKGSEAMEDSEHQDKEFLLVIGVHLEPHVNIYQIFRCQYLC